jgi:hypothetical protein
MKKNAFLPLVCFILFDGSDVHGMQSSPDLSIAVINGETKKGETIQGWEVISKQGEWGEKAEELYAYNAWILFKPNEEKYQPGYALKYVFVNSDQTKKIVFGKKIEDPLRYKFRGPLYTEEKSDRLGSRPWKKGVRILNKFPNDCDMLEK